MKRCDDATHENSNAGRSTPSAPIKQKPALATVSIRHLACGSLSSEPGDRVLSVTTDVSQAAEQLCALLAEGASSSHASFFVMTPPDTGMPAIAHVQGAMTVFGNGVRSYATRVVYECESDELEKVGGYAAVLPMLDRMRRYEKAEFDVPAEKRVEVNDKRELTSVEKVLYEYMAYCLVHDTRLFVKLGDDERWRGDDIRQSKRLAALLHAIDHLPPAWRERASLAFSVECKDGSMQVLTPAMRFIAHHDPFDEWGGETSGACMLDWTSHSITWANVVHPVVRPCIDEMRYLEDHLPDEADAGMTEDEQMSRASQTGQTMERRRRGLTPLGRALLLALALLGLLALLAWL